MSSEILAVLEYMEKEKGISREDMIATIEGAVKAAAEIATNSSRDIRVEISPKTGAMEAEPPLCPLLQLDLPFLYDERSL